VMQGLSGKGVLITGGSQGIGYATAVRFLAEGCRVHICSRHEATLGAAVTALRERGGSTSGSVADIGLKPDVDDLVSRAEAELGRIDILINNAGVAWEEPFLDTTVEHWDEVLRANLRGMFLVGQAVARRMRDDGRGGVIVNMSSTNGIDGEANYAHYNASKGGVTLLTKTMALELGQYGIRVNAVCPGYIVTPMSQAIDNEAFVAAYVADKIPLGRTGLPEDVASAYAFLASDEASFIHGTTLVIDGGQLAS
jgi:NAD(P)-dependent dehydrogenase (short-subunit alcohol dehydrogenase family)